MSERVLPLRGIAVFDAAARASSFQAAAEELNLTPSAVSHQIRLLENILGVRLFNRVGRGVVLSPDGAEYARSVRQSLRRMRSATREIRSRGKSGKALNVVRIEMPPSFAHCWLMPRLADLSARYPDIDIRVNAQGNYLPGAQSPFPMLADAPADVHIVYGARHTWEDRASLLLPEVFQPYCTPSFLNDHDFARPEALLQTKLISTVLNVVSWDDWFNIQGVDMERVEGVGAIQIDPSHLAIRAALDGVGVILESSALVARELNDGTLVPPFPALSRPGAGYWIYTPSANGLRPCVEAVRQWFEAMAEENYLNA
ncbi:LysR family transcriptional regulator [Sphingopyxis sp. JAI108]|uniref:LysR family transcriptional regulator n=1 Tax=Sphingopyxis sp. JAI108 TaxID=2723060 RepID=UPI0015CA2026|nr:LysR family transcriptional regulator [Sphingopyxis sp. JAI108]NYF30601.1 LysR family glycine cleavage system transcriptional activator [Sphingopyxis sp. JAI108]